MKTTKIANRIKEDKQMERLLLRWLFLRTDLQNGHKPNQNPKRLF